MRRSGFSLIMVLIVLMMGSIFVSTALYLVENFHSSSSKSVRRMELYSMAMSELESAKAKLDLELMGRPYPLGKYSNGNVPSWDEISNDGIPFDALVARKGGAAGSAMVYDRTAGNLTAKTIIYDLVYPNSSLGNQDGLPPRRSGKLHISPEGSSEAEDNYDGSENRDLLIYLVRTNVMDHEGRSITVEQTVERKIEGG